MLPSTATAIASPRQRRVLPVRGECISPLLECEITGEDGGGALVALANQVMVVLVVRRTQWLQAGIIDDEGGAMASCWKRKSWTP